MLAAYSILILKLLDWSRRRAVDGPGLVVVVVVVVVRLQFAPHRRDARMLPSPPSHMEQGTKGEKKKEGLLSCHCRVREATRYLPRQQNKRQGPNQHQGSVRDPVILIAAPSLRRRHDNKPGWECARRNGTWWNEEGSSAIVSSGTCPRSDVQRSFSIPQRAPSP
ncbi:hypothetical protein CCHR01_09926 [Colletotrichum chrysophilum]|uniref:Uncharacterized protein n=1 Tax=Colletotrichum chrysophilum TaxID=1836956 RepID=A0AAD9AGW2_9PEZI|nr:hypothetical protein CCHR01_09926 [Colletotrichum chrysophilum]